MTRPEFRNVGISTTVPLEPFLSSGKVPVDLNNSFIGSDNPVEEVEEAQVKGYPRNICTWIKGLDTASMNVDAVVGVVRGDCSNTESLLEALHRTGKKVHPFSYPYDRERDGLVNEIEELCEFLETTIEEASKMASVVRDLRDLALKVDEIGWQNGSISAEDVHISLVSTSDMGGDITLWRDRTETLIDGSREPMESTGGPRLAYIGVPPIITDLYPRIEGLGASVVFFEVQRQFAMPSSTGDWIQDYLEYTYPYNIGRRVDDIISECEKRKVDGIVHYVQSFCHRQIDDMIFRKELDLPIMTLEGNLPGPLDERNLIRLEAFLDVLEGGP